MNVSINNYYYQKQQLQQQYQINDDFEHPSTSTISNISSLNNNNNNDVSTLTHLSSFHSYQDQDIQNIHYYYHDHAYDIPSNSSSSFSSSNLHHHLPSNSSTSNYYLSQNHFHPHQHIQRDIPLYAHSVHSKCHQLFTNQYHHQHQQQQQHHHISASSSSLSLDSTITNNRSSYDQQFPSFSSTTFNNHLSSNIHSFQKQQQEQQYQYQTCQQPQKSYTDTNTHQYHHYHYHHHVMEDNEIMNDRKKKDEKEKLYENYEELMTLEEEEEFIKGVIEVIEWEIEINHQEYRQLNYYSAQKSRSESKEFYRVRKMENLEEYIYKLIQCTQLNKSVYINALIYMNRLSKEDELLKLNEYNIQAILLIAIILAMKFLDDNNKWNIQILNIFNNHIYAFHREQQINIEYINELEIIMLKKLHWNCSVDIETYRIFENCIFHRRKQHEQQQHSKYSIYEQNDRVEVDGYVEDDIFEDDDDDDDEIDSMEEDDDDMEETEEEEEEEDIEEEEIEYGNSEGHKILGQLQNIQTYHDQYYQYLHQYRNEQQRQQLLEQQQIQHEQEQRCEDRTGIDRCMSLDRGHGVMDCDEESVGIDELRSDLDIEVMNLNKASDLIHYSSNCNNNHHVVAAYGVIGEKVKQQKQTNKKIYTNMKRGEKEREKVYKVIKCKQISKKSIGRKQHGKKGKKCMLMLIRSKNKEKKNWERGQVMMLLIDEMNKYKDKIVEEEIEEEGNNDIEFVEGIDALRSDMDQQVAFNDMNVGGNCSSRVSSFGVIGERVNCIDYDNNDNDDDDDDDEEEEVVVTLDMNNSNDEDEHFVGQKKMIWGRRILAIVRKLFP